MIIIRTEWLFYYQSKFQSKEYYQGYFVMIKGSIYQEKTDKNVCTECNFKIKQKWIELQRELDKFTVIVKESHIILTIIDRISGQKVNKNIKDFYNIVKDLIWSQLCFYLLTTNYQKIKMKKSINLTKDVRDKSGQRFPKSIPWIL